MFDEPWWYYLVSWMWQLLPWTGALLLAARGSWQRAVQRRRSPDRFLWCWAIVPIAVLSLSRGKHHHYILAPLCGLTPLLSLGLLRLGSRVAAAAVALTVLGMFYAHGWVVPSVDPSWDDRQFLQSVRRYVPESVPLAAIGGPEIARHIFYVEPPLIATWHAAALRDKLGRVPVFYVIARQTSVPQLQELGETVQVAQSVKTRRERSPADRYTLFEVKTRRP
jgi:4-amino-4-deoxy-L-arabinose transferase-like glycosyltransferase